MGCFWSLVADEKRFLIVYCTVHLLLFLSFRSFFLASVYSRITIYLQYISNQKMFSWKTAKIAIVSAYLHSSVKSSTVENYKTY